MNPAGVALGVVIVGGLGYVVYKELGVGATGGAGVSVRCKVGRVIAGIWGAKISDEQCATADAIDDVIGLNAVKNALFPQSWASKDAENKAANGPVELELSSELAGATGQYDLIPTANPIEPGYKVGALLQGSVLRFKNGGVPFAAHPSFSKCAPGTHDMTAGKNNAQRFWCLVPGKRPSSAQMSSAFRAAVGKSPAEIRALLKAIGISMDTPPRLSDLFRGSNNDPSTSIPLSIVAGVKHVCQNPAEQLYEVLPVTDHRAGSLVTMIVKRCGPPGTLPGTVATPIGGDGGGGTGTTTILVGSPTAPPPGYRWVAATATVPAHLERI